LKIDHLAGSVAPVSKTTTYGTVTNIPGATSKCWITSNLGADHQAMSVDDATEAYAGWYWQFNRLQGYRNDGKSVSPSWTISSIDENSDWLNANDPCAVSLEDGWRLPTGTEWSNVQQSNGWSSWGGPWGSPLKLHAAGGLGNIDGSLFLRGSSGYYWSSVQNGSTFGSFLILGVGICKLISLDKAYGYSVRCLRDN
jgi:hypothetical protein